MGEIHKGGCLCESTRFSVAGETEFTIDCYCRDCQHISGAGHLPQCIFLRGDFSVSGPVKTHKRKADSGNDLEVGFCGECGSPLFKTTTMFPDKIAVYVGGFDDQSGFTFSQKVHEGSRQHWDEN